MIQLEGLSEFCGQSNQPGLIDIEYLPLSWINPTQYAQIIHHHNWQKDIGFINGVPGWLKAKVRSSEKIWTEKHKRTKQGPYYDQTVKAIVPGLKPSVSGEFEKMDQDDYLLRILDQNNVKWLLGTKDFPFSFFSDGTTGSDSDLNNYAVRFVAQTKHRAFGFLPVF